MNFNVAELLEATGGSLRSGNLAHVAEKISTDTRSIQAGELFVALDGPNFKGDEFIDAAMNRGACGVIANVDEPPAGFPKDKIFIQVPDTTTALGDIAKEWRMVVDPTICAITGSSGKTTTKEMLAFICRPDFNLHATDGNKNNLIGLPLTLLRLKEENEVAIIEAGMNQPGELTRLSEIAIPDIGIITNIGNAHIGNFGTVEKLIAAKAELFEGMPRNGTAIVNIDCPHASLMAEAFRIPEMVITYGQIDKADVRAVNVRLTEPYGYEFELKVLDSRQRVHLKVFGRYQVHNALAAAAAAAALGVSPRDIAQRLSEFHTPELRANAEWIDGILVLGDCYNASPDATITSLRSLEDLGFAERRIAVLGDMYELGEHREMYHRRVGAAVAEARIDFLCTIGEASHFILEEAENRGIAALHFDDAEEIVEFLDRKLQAKDAVIIKGSRGLKLETVLNGFRARRAAVRNGENIPAAGVKNA